MEITLKLDELNPGRPENFFTHYDSETIVGDIPEKREPQADISN